MRIIEYVEQFNAISVCIRLMVAAFFGGCIGWERSSQGQSAGIRTFSLVALGSALAMVTDEYLVCVYQTGDPARLAAQVISGIGFLGVGTIIVTGKNYVRGLTTAASLWATACMGIAIGSGYVVGSVMAFVLIMFVITAMTKISHHVDSYRPQMKLYLEVDKESGIDAVYEFVEEQEFVLKSIEKQKRQSLQGKDVVLIVTIDMKRRSNHSDCIDKMYELDDIHYIEEIR